MRGLYAIVDPQACRAPYRDPIELAEEILAGGCAVMQLRAKQLDDSAYVTLARPIIARCHRAGVPFIVNDRVHLVNDIGADGVHLGQSDMPVSAARKQLGRCFIGISTHTPEQAQKAANDTADWIAFGPIFATASKINAEPTVGIPALHSLCATISKPIIVIGGLDADNAGDAVQAGASMIAVISHLARAEDPRLAAAQLQGLFHVKDPSEPTA